MASQTTSNILMVRPANFGFNEETAASNAFQNSETTLSQEEISRRAVAEFDQFVTKLREKGVHVTVAQDSDYPVKPDAVFPNNWVTFHEDGTVLLYPMYAPVRRLERQPDIIEQIRNVFVIGKMYHLEHFEDVSKYLEGTGSMILDRQHEIVYACLSPRTDLSLLDEFCEIMGYKRVAFRAVDGEGKEIYHTNVMMALGETFVVICLDTIPNENEKNLLLKTLADTGKEIISITLGQMLSFAGNMLQVRNPKGETFLVMSSQAYRSLTPEQIAQIEKHTQILHSEIETIETFGGGSARCMMAEIFLPTK